MSNPERQLDSFIDKFTPEVGERGRRVVTALRQKMPTAFCLVYDNYNALAVGFGPDERASNAILSVAFYPKWISLFFLQAAGLEDPSLVLKGSGAVARHVVLDKPADIDRPAIGSLIEQALLSAKVPLAKSGVGPLIIKSVSAKQRSRRPGA
jgi:hypothetical protein